MRREKKVYLIRHGQSEYNLLHGGGLSDSGSGVDPMVFDAPLTELGKEQARGIELPEDPELVVCSPLTRAVQTALLAFPGHVEHMECWPEHRERCLAVFAAMQHEVSSELTFMKISRQPLSHPYSVPLKLRLRMR